MSTLRTNNIGNVAGTQSTDVLNVINGSAKAWVNFNGTGTVAIRAAYNVSSITDNGVGDYTVNFTTAMPDANYAVQITGRTDNNTAIRVIGYIANDAPTTGSVRIQHHNIGAYYDTQQSNVSIFR